jgi:hypothetical protein
MLSAYFSDSGIVPVSLFHKDKMIIHNSLLKRSDRVLLQTCPPVVPNAKAGLPTCTEITPNHIILDRLFEKRKNMDPSM